MDEKSMRQKHPTLIEHIEIMTLAERTISMIHGAPDDHCNTPYRVAHSVLTTTLSRKQEPYHELSNLCYSFIFTTFAHQSNSQRLNCKKNVKWIMIYNNRVSNSEN